jgi:poly(A) polymerase
MTRVAGDWLDRPATQAVLALLVDAGHRALAVGGCVRNALLGMPVADIDIATDARPERVTALARGRRAARCADRHRPWHGDAGGRGRRL